MYIHGESFEWNSGNPYDGSILAAHGNIIVVTINFRLGVLGEFYTLSHFSLTWPMATANICLCINGVVCHCDWQPRHGQMFQLPCKCNFRLFRYIPVYVSVSVFAGFLKTGAKGSAQGNFGLMDLVAGLHWLRENLPAFNGDPSKVTLMGHGTGAALANVLIVSPVASDLIRRAILLSGSALSPWAIQKDPLYVKRKVAEHTGCHGDLVEDDLAPCLRTKTVAELLSVTMQVPR